MQQDFSSRAVKAIPCSIASNHLTCSLYIYGLLSTSFDFPPSDYLLWELEHLPFTRFTIAREQLRALPEICFSGDTSTQEEEEEWLHPAVQNVGASIWLA